jgi:hypothetical protein
MLSLCVRVPVGACVSLFPFLSARLGFMELIGEACDQLHSILASQMAVIGWTCLHMRDCLCGHSNVFAAQSPHLSKCLSLRSPCLTCCFC